MHKMSSIGHGRSKINAELTGEGACDVKGTPHFAFSQSLLSGLTTPYKSRRKLATVGS